MGKFPNKNVVNVKSPSNESALIGAYKEMNPRANKHDGLDVSAVRTVSGERGYVLLPEAFNRSKDREVHRGQDFISKEALEKHIKNKNKK